MNSRIDECAREILEVVPLIMRVIRIEMRSQRLTELSIPQFRVLIYINQHPGASLSQVAEYIGLTLPSASSLVDGLVQHGLITRQTSSGDRRRMFLKLTSAGQEQMNFTLHQTESRLAETLACLPVEKQDQLFEAMQILRTLFTPSWADKSPQEGTSPSANQPKSA